MHWLVEILLSMLLLIGAIFVLLGSYSLLRMPDFYMRLHGPTKATTLGSGSILIASSIYFFVYGQASLHEILITLFLFFTAPISAYLLAKTARHLRMQAIQGSDVITQPNSSMPVSRQDL